MTKIDQIADSFVARHDMIAGMIGGLPELALRANAKESTPLERDALRETLGAIHRMLGFSRQDFDDVLKRLRSCEKERAKLLEERIPRKDVIAKTIALARSRDDAWRNLAIATRNGVIPNGFADLLVKPETIPGPPVCAYCGRVSRRGVDCRFCGAPADTRIATWRLPERHETLYLHPDGRSEIRPARDGDQHDDH